MSDLLTSVIGCLVAVAARDAAGAVLRAAARPAAGVPPSPARRSRVARAVRARPAAHGWAGLSADHQAARAASDAPVPTTESQIIQEIAAAPGRLRRAQTHEIDAADELLEADTGLRLAAVHYEATRDPTTMTVAAVRFCAALTDRDRLAMRRYAERRIDVVSDGADAATGVRPSTSDENARIGRVDRSMRRPRVIRAVDEPGAPDERPTPPTGDER